MNSKISKLDQGSPYVNLGQASVTCERYAQSELWRRLPAIPTEPRQRPSETIDSPEQLRLARLRREAAVAHDAPAGADPPGLPRLARPPIAGAATGFSG